eukprot:gene14529-17158_t
MTPIPPNTYMNPTTPLDGMTNNNNNSVITDSPSFYQYMEDLDNQEPQGYGQYPTAQSNGSQDYTSIDSSRHNGPVPSFPVTCAPVYSFDPHSQTLVEHDQPPAKVQSIYRPKNNKVPGQTPGQPLPYHRKASKWKEHAKRVEAKDDPTTYCPGSDPSCQIIYSSFKWLDPNAIPLLTVRVGQNLIEGGGKLKLEARVINPTFKISGVTNAMVEGMYTHFANLKCTKDDEYKGQITSSNTALIRRETYSGQLPPNIIVVTGMPSGLLHFTLELHSGHSLRADTNLFTVAAQNKTTGFIEWATFQYDSEVTYVDEQTIRVKIENKYLNPNIYDLFIYQRVVPDIMKRTGDSYNKMNHNMLTSENIGLIKATIRGQPLPPPARRTQIDIPPHLIAHLTQQIDEDDDDHNQQQIIYRMENLNRGGFNFDLCNRNNLMEKTGMKMPGFLKTGTTIVGVVYKDGVVLGADTRATEGTIVADKNCEKIHFIADNIYCCGAGTAADTEMTTALISSKLKLHKLSTGKEVRVVTALTMLKQMLFRYQGHVSAALILGGIDINGPSLYTIYPHGSVDQLPYVTMGSGSLAAMAIFEANYKADMTKEEAINLVAQAIKSGIFNDLGSGSNVDVTVLTHGGVEILRGYETPNDRKYRSEPYIFKQGTTPILSHTQLPPLSTRVTIEEVPMES